MNLDELQSLYDFKDRTVLVTGGTGVLGLKIVCALVECNANVIILSLNPEQTTESVAESMVASPRIQVCETDGICFLVKRQSNVDNFLLITKYVIRLAYWKVNLRTSVYSF
jgi:FlaA1/EpsC-like NDP-sugar epimerase